MFIRKPSGSWQTTQITGKGGLLMAASRLPGMCSRWGHPCGHMASTISARLTHPLCMAAAARDRTRAVFIRVNPTSCAQGTPAFDLVEPFHLAYWETEAPETKERPQLAHLLGAVQGPPSLPVRSRVCLPQYNSPAPLHIPPDTFTGSTPTSEVLRVYVRGAGRSRKGTGINGS